MQGQQSVHAMAPSHQPVGAGISSYGSYPGGASSENPAANQETLSVDGLKQMNALNHHQQGYVACTMLLLWEEAFHGHGKSICKLVAGGIYRPYTFHSKKNIYYFHFL